MSLAVAQQPLHVAVPHYNYGQFQQQGGLHQPVAHAPQQFGQPAYIPGVFHGAAVADSPQTPEHRLGKELDVIAIRFIVNCPGADDKKAAKDEMNLLMFEIEKAHWFYCDFSRAEDPLLPALGLRDFSLKMFQRVPFLRIHVNNFPNIFSAWQAYKKQVPTFGACILNQNLNKVLLVRGWNGKTWGWPKGKVNKNEPDAVCAAREVYEEIGFDISPWIQESQHIGYNAGDQFMKLYIIPGIPDNTVFQTLTRQEISEIRWHSLADITGDKQGEGKAQKYWSVKPVLGKLNAWIDDYKRSISRSKTPLRNKKGEPQQQQSRATDSYATPPRGGRDNTTNKKTSPSKGKKKNSQVEVDAAGVERNNKDTFGNTDKAKGFSPEEMFKVNEEKFGMTTTYSFDHYTTALPGQGKNSPSGEVLYPERFRQITISDAEVDKSGTPQPGPKPTPTPGNFSFSSGFKLDTMSIMAEMDL